MSNGLPNALSRNFYVVTYAVNLAMIPVFLTCGVTGILLFPGFLGFCGISMRRFPLDTVVWLHDWSGLVLVAGVLFHLYLHWKPTWQFIQKKLLPGRGKKRAPKVPSRTDLIEVEA